MSWSGWKALPDVREWLRGPPGCPGVVVSLSRMSGSSREALPDGRQALPDGQEALPNVWECLASHPGCT